jgi:inorganic triphosphatase YgiF
MTVHTERELKFLADRTALRTALTLPLPGAVIQGPFSQALKSTYFDTKALELMRHGVSLRVRQSGGKCILGFKRDVCAHGGYFEREEDEAALPSSKVDLNVLDRKVSSELRGSSARRRSRRDLAQTFGERLRRSGSIAQTSKLPSMKAFSSPATGKSRLMKSSSSLRPESLARCSISALLWLTCSP